MAIVTQFLKYLLYRSFVSRILLKVVYYKWNKRLRYKSKMLSGEKLHSYLPINRIWQYHPSEKVYFNLPLDADVDNLPKQIKFYVHRTFPVSAGEVYEFENAFLIGENAVGLTSDGQIILDTAMDLPNVLSKCSPRLLMNYKKLETNKELNTVFSLVHIFCNNHYVNYFHWITDSLILIEGWRFYKKSVDPEAKLLVNDNLKPFQIELLKLVGVEDLDLVSWVEHQKVKVKKLIVGKSRRTGTNMDEIVSPSGMKWLRETVYSNLLKSKPLFKKRFFLSRQDTDSRRIVNYDELLPLFEKFEIEVVSTDSLSVVEQVNLFMYAEFVFSVHGAGLTNIIFSENLTILELIGNVDVEGDFQWYCAYYSMSQALGHRYSFLSCETIPLLKPGKTKQIYDVKVDVQQVELRLQKLLNDL